MDNALAFTAGVAIVALYASNCATAFPAINAWRSEMPSPIHRAWALGYAVAALFRPCLLHRELSVGGRSDLVRTIAPWVAYVSFGGALLLCLTHIAWLVSGAWQYQDHLFEFAAGHYLTGLAIHGFHVLLLYTAPGRSDAPARS